MKIIAISVIITSIILAEACTAQVPLQVPTETTTIAQSSIHQETSSPSQTLVLPENKPTEPSPPHQTTPLSSVNPRIPPDKKVNGSLEYVNGIPILRLWGSREEMGYAYGYLCANDLVDQLEKRLFGMVLANSASNMTYEKWVALMKRSIRWPDGYLDEMNAMLHGIEDALGSLPVITNKRIEAGSKKLELEMLAFFSLPLEMSMSQQCSSFAAWGDMTGDGQTRVAGNTDFGMASLEHHFILLVRRPSYGFSTVSANVFGSIGTGSGMNENGIAITSQFHDAPWANTQQPLYPCELIKRDILEKEAAGADLNAKILTDFKIHPVVSSRCLLFAQGKPTWNQPKDDQISEVIEIDANGMTVRLPSNNVNHDTPLKQAIVATNNYWQRQIPNNYHPSISWSKQQADSIDRYKKIVGTLGAQKVTDVSDMQRVLQSASRDTSMHSIYFELESKKIYVAVRWSENDPPSPYINPISFTWDELFAGIPK